MHLTLGALFNILSTLNSVFDAEPGGINFGKNKMG